MGVGKRVAQKHLPGPCRARRDSRWSCPSSLGLRSAHRLGGSLWTSCSIVSLGLCGAGVATASCWLPQAPPSPLQLKPILSDIEYLQDQHILLTVKSLDGYESYGEWLAGWRQPCSGWPWQLCALQLVAPSASVASLFPAGTRQFAVRSQKVGVWGASAG